MKPSTPSSSTRCPPQSSHTRTQRARRSQRVQRTRGHHRRIAALCVCARRLHLGCISATSRLHLGHLSPRSILIDKITDGLKETFASTTMHTAGAEMLRSQPKPADEGGTVMEGLALQNIQARCSPRSPTPTRAPCPTTPTRTCACAVQPPQPERVRARAGALAHGHVLLPRAAHAVGHRQGPLHRRLAARARLGQRRRGAARLLHQVRLLGRRHQPDRRHQQARPQGLPLVGGRRGQQLHRADPGAAPAPIAPPHGAHRSPRAAPWRRAPPLAPRPRRACRRC